MIVADEALYMKRRPSDLLYASLLLKSIDEPPEVNRIQNALMMIRLYDTKPSQYIYIYICFRPFMYNLPIKIDICYIARCKLSLASFTKFRASYHEIIFIIIYIKNYIPI